MPGAICRSAVPVGCLYILPKLQPIRAKVCGEGKAFETILRGTRPSIAGTKSREAEQVNRLLSEEPLFESWIEPRTTIQAGAHGCAQAVII